MHEKKIAKQFADPSLIHSCLHLYEFNYGIHVIWIISLFIFERCLIRFWFRRVQLENEYDDHTIALHLFSCEKLKKKWINQHYSLVRRCPIKLLLSTIEFVLVAGRLASSNLNCMRAKEKQRWLLDHVGAQCDEWKRIWHFDFVQRLTKGSKK